MPCRFGRNGTGSSSNQSGECLDPLLERRSPKATKGVRHVGSGAISAPGRASHSYRCLPTRHESIASRSRSISRIHSCSVGRTFTYLAAKIWRPSLSTEYVAMASFFFEHRIKPIVGLSPSVRAAVQLWRQTSLVPKIRNALRSTLHPPQGCAAQFPPHISLVPAILNALRSQLEKPEISYACSPARRTTAARHLRPWIC